MVTIKTTLDMDKTLYLKITKNALQNERSISGEIRFQLQKAYMEKN